VGKREKGKKPGPKKEVMRERKEEEYEVQQLPEGGLGRVIGRQVLAYETLARKGKGGGGGGF